MQVKVLFWSLLSPLNFALYWREMIQGVLSRFLLFQLLVFNYAFERKKIQICDQVVC